MTAINAVLGSKEALMDDCRTILKALTDCTELEAQANELTSEIDIVSELVRRCVDENATSAGSQEEYAAKYKALSLRFERASSQLAEVKKAIADRKARAADIGDFMFEVQELDAITQFDKKLWLSTVDRVTAYSDGRLVFQFRNGMEQEA